MTYTHSVHLPGLRRAGLREVLQRLRRQPRARTLRRTAGGALGPGPLLSPVRPAGRCGRRPDGRAPSGGPGSWPAALPAPGRRHRLQGVGQSRPAGAGHGQRRRRRGPRHRAAGGPAGPAPDISQHDPAGAIRPAVQPDHAGRRAGRHRPGAALHPDGAGRLRSSSNHRRGCPVSRRRAPAPDRRHPAPARWPTRSWRSRPTISSAISSAAPPPLPGRPRRRRPARAGVPARATTRRCGGPASIWTSAGDRGFQREADGSDGGQR